jgi:hypothetical protein
MQRGETMPTPSGFESFEKPDSRHSEAVSRTLRELVQHFRVCYETVPDYCFIDHVRQQNGFVLELFGTHEQGVEHPIPGCHHCHNVRMALEVIAKYILPREKRDSEYDIAPFDHSIQYSSVRNNRPDVSLRISIQHRTGFDRGVDACEIQCLNEMTQQLKELGASERGYGRKTEQLYGIKSLKNPFAQD